MVAGTIYSQLTLTVILYDNSKQHGIQLSKGAGAISEHESYTITGWYLWTVG